MAPSAEHRTPPRGRSPRWAGWLLLALFGTVAANVNGERAGEFQLKAAFIFHVTSFVEWPDSSFESAEQPFRICLIGGDPFGASIRSLETKHYHKRPIRIELVAADGDLARCQIAYFSEPVPQRFHEIARGRSGLPILTVSSADRFATDGGVIRFDSSSERLRMEINAGSARSAGLRVSAKLLEVAARVIDPRAEGKRS